MRLARGRAQASSCRAGAGHAWEDGDAVAGVCYFRTPRGCDGAVPRKEASAKAHLTIVCDGMYSALRGTASSLGPALLAACYNVYGLAGNAQHIVLMTQCI